MNQNHITFNFIPLAIALGCLVALRIARIILTYTMDHAYKELALAFKNGVFIKPDKATERRRRLYSVFSYLGGNIRLIYNNYCYICESAAFICADHNLFFHYLQSIRNDVSFEYKPFTLALYYLKEGNPEAAQLENGRVIP